MNYECSICFENIEKNDIFNTSVCMHIYHNRCMCLWHQKYPNRQLTCPSCRIIIPKLITSQLGKYRTIREKKTFIYSKLVYYTYYTYYLLLLFADIKFISLLLLVVLLLSCCIIWIYILCKGWVRFTV
jgi:hypothetical protein